MVIGVFGPFLEGIAHAEIVQFLGEGAIGGGGNADPGREGLIFFGVSVDPTPIGWGLALGVIAGAFEIGRRLQRDVDGLV